MKNLIVIFNIASCIGQVLPTVPENIFRVTLSNYSFTSQLDLNNQEFSMRGVGRAYFDDETKNEFGFFSGVNDLYHMGDMLLNETEKSPPFDIVDIGAVELVTLINSNLADASLIK